MTRTQYWLSGSALALICGIATPGLAQEQAAEDARTADIVVTANRVSTLASKTPLRA